MNKQRTQEWSEVPGLHGPDYLSLVIEWEDLEVLDATPDDDLEGATTTRQRSGWDLVDEASLESFPASDPPVWGSAHAAPSVHTATIGSKPLAKPRHWFRKILTPILAIGALFAFVQHVRHRHA